MKRKPCTRCVPIIGTILVLAFLLAFEKATPAAVGRGEEKLSSGPIDCVPKPIASDPTVKYDYNIVYVRLPRKPEDRKSTYWAEVIAPHLMPVGGDLMLLHPGGSEELLAAGGEDGSIQDPMVSFDGQWVYYTHFRGLTRTTVYNLSPAGADIYKVHVKSRKIVRLTDQTFTPNTGAADWAKDYRTPEKGKTHLHYGVINCGPCPLPGGKVAFTSNRNAHVVPRNNNSGAAMQLFVMDDDGKNVEQIGHLNLGGALHPMALTDGRIAFSSLEHQGLRGSSGALWGLWSIHPDGSNWNSIVGAYHDTFHFATQLSDGNLVVELYYNNGNMGFGTYYKLPPRAPEGTPATSPADTRLTPRLRVLPWLPSPLIRMPFQPYGMETLTRFATDFDVKAAPDRPVKNYHDYDGPRLGKVTHPAAAPDNHLLTVWSPGSVHGHDRSLDGGIYLIKGGKPINGPGEMLLIKNDPKYHEQWPRALVPYQRIYGIAEPKMLPALRNDGKHSRYLPEGTPFGLVGTSSLSKRESAPGGAVRGQSVTADTTDDWLQHAYPHEYTNWVLQGADAGRYDNSDIWGIRILALEPTTDLSGIASQNRRFYNHAHSERMRILGEFPVRKFGKDGKQPIDPDGNPDTSFLAKIPANMSWTFQTLDHNGMVLNMAQTWHQIRPGEIRNDCGGCHAHSQQPTDFKLTAAAKPDYVPFDLTKQAPLLTSKKNDQSGKQWDAKNQTGLRYARGGVANVEFYRDIQPILKRSCTACHTKSWNKSAGNLVLDDDTPVKNSLAAGALGYSGGLPGSYARLAADNMGIFWKHPRGHMNTRQASRYIWGLQSRRSLLAWKLYGKRLDGFHDEDFTTESVPGDNTTLQHNGRAVDAKTWKFKDDPKKHAPDFSISYQGSIMPPPKAVTGDYVGSDGQKIKVAPLTEEDRRTIVRWIDLGCPIDLDYDPAHPDKRGYGFACDDQRPTLTLTSPQAGANKSLTRILVGMHDYYTGLDMDSFQVTADFAIDGVAAGENIVKKFHPVSPGIWEMKLARPITDLKRGQLTVAVKDRQGNITRIERTISIGRSAARKGR